ncbi:hypothetical protein ABI59_18470 [Acidobacteria bacterium Mor1]|nr:hypothetical protein ABI59_18470 [Acidobacteria bacterium Mor1]
MELGQFSVSLTVKDLPASREFYKKLGFSVVTLSHDPEAFPGYDESWVILENGPVKVGLFQGMFDKNMLTFNPTDVRSIQASLKEQGVAFIKEAEPGDGPASAMLLDPDENPILLDQH